MLNNILLHLLGILNTVIDGRTTQCEVSQHVLFVGPTGYNNNNNTNGRNGSFLRGWLPHRGKAQIACNYCFPTLEKQLFHLDNFIWHKMIND